MAYREVSRVEIAEVVRRWQSGMSQWQIATGTGLSRAIVSRYIDAAVEAGLARDGPAPSEEQLTRLAGLSLAGPTMRRYDAIAPGCPRRRPEKLTGSESGWSSRSSESSRSNMAHGGSYCVALPT